MKDIKEYLEVGKIVNTHGINGDVKVQPWCDSAEFLCDFDHLYLDNEGKQKIAIVSSKKHKNCVIMRLKDIDDIEKANSIKENILFVKRKDIKLDEGTYFIQDIIGCNVFNIDDINICYGKVTEVLKTGANDVYQITSDSGKNYLIPVIKDVVIKIEISNKKIFIRPLDGIFENEN